jgi:hypothetical protein
MRPRIEDQAAVRALMLRPIVADDGMIELRSLRDGHPTQGWHLLPQMASDEAAAMAATHDVYAGVLPRFDFRGGRDALRYGRIVWADCDAEGAVEALHRFRPGPTFVLRSGGLAGQSPRLHAWWVLEHLWAPAAIEKANRRIAHHLGSDDRVCDAARILRLPGTLNHKTTPARAVVCTWVGESVPLGRIVSALPDPEPTRLQRAARTVPRDETLALIPADVYVPALCGRDVGHNGKVRCPLHADGMERTPSLHVYDGDAGWYCFGCGVGGDVISFAAALWGLDPHGDFLAVRSRLHDELGLRRAA